MKYLNLYVQTEYSLLSSFIKIKDYIDYAKKKGLTSLAIADKNCYGMYKFYKEATSANIKPILGLNVSIGEEDQMLLFAYSNEGYLHLLEIASLNAMGNVNMEEITKRSKGLICILPYLESLPLREYSNINKITYLNKLKNIFDYFYVGIKLPFSDDTNSFIIDDLCKSEGIETVLLNKTLYLEKKDEEVYLTLRKISLNSFVYEESMEEKNAFFKNEVFIETITKDRPHLIKNLEFIESLCNVSIDNSGYKLPIYNKDDKVVDESYLESLAKVGLNKRLKGKNKDLDKYRQRLLYELDVIKKMGFSDYFLIVYDYVKYAKTHGILVGPGRGSAAGSLVSYALGITNIDPIEYDLLFERFLNPERLSMPDIDVDFPDDRREEIIAYIGQRFGLDRVAHLNTFGTFGAKSAIRDVGKALGIDSSRLNVISDYIPQVSSPPLKNIMEGHQEIKRMCENDKDIAKLFNIASQIEAMPRHVSTHASGIIVSPLPLTNYTALQSGLSGIMQTQYDADDIQDIGLIKFDILGLRNLNTIQLIIDSVKKDSNDVIDFYNIPLDDKETLALLSRGETEGVFQFESAGMRKTMKDMGIDSFKDVYNCLSLYRPGPMDMIPQVIERKHGKKYKCIVEAIEPILSSTYGAIVYQEQIMQIANVVSSYTLGQADILRRGISKKKQEILMSERSRFITQGKANGYDEITLDKLYSDIVKFAGYGFNKSHAVVYAYISYVLAYLKCHYFINFMAAIMDSAIGKEKDMQSYNSMCIAHGINVMYPDINISSISFVCKDNNLYYPLSMISSIGEKTAHEIIKERSNGLFKTYDEFVSRSAAILNKKQVVMLAYAGAFDSLCITRKSAVEEYDTIMLRQNFSSKSNQELKTLEYSKDEYSLIDIEEYEREALGLNLKYDTFMKYKDLIDKYQALSIASFLSSNKTEAIIVTKVLSIHDIKTKTNTDMSFVLLEDKSMSLEVTMFSKEYTMLRRILVEGNVFVMKVEKTLRNDNVQLILKNARDITF